jgi:dienelactone hydrolase
MSARRWALVAAMVVLGACGSSGGGDTVAPDVTADAVEVTTDALEVTADAAEVAADVPKEQVEALPFQPAGPGVTPDPMAPGPFPVGVRTYDLYDDSRPNAATGKGRWLRTEVWYPAVQAARDLPLAVVSLKEEAKGIDLGDKADLILNADVPDIPTDAHRDAALDAAHGPYPVLLFSHGANGIRWQSVFYTVHLASHGYVVISPDHESNTLWDILISGVSMSSIGESIPARILDQRFLLDTALGWNADPAHPLHGAIDPEHVGATGHSLGGITSTGLACADPRIDTVVLHSPQILAGLAAGHCLGKPYPVPNLTMGGTLDETLKYCGQYCDYKDRLPLEPAKYLFELVNGGHFTFSDVCLLDLVDIANKLELGTAATHILNDGCGEQNVPYDEAHQAINHYATAFLNWQLRGSEGSRELLIDRDDPPFEHVNFFEGDVPDFWGEGGCANCKQF